MKKKGFTLIELLAVIVILAVIMVIAVPKIIDVIEKSRESAARSSAKGFIEAIDTNNKLVGFNSGYTKINDGEYTNVEEFNNVKIRGDKPTSANVTVTNGKVSQAELCILNYKVTYSNSNITSVVKGCSASSTSGPTKELPKNGETWLATVYLDPTDLTKTCTKAQAEANVGAEGILNGLVKSGCMKWYAYKSEGTNYKLILDHNTTSSVSWGSGGCVDNGPDLSLAQLQTDTTGWQVTADLITADEIKAITGNTTFNSLTTAEAKPAFYFDSNSTNQTANASNKSKYAWLFDNLYACSNYGCNKEHIINSALTSQYSTQAYWTKTKVSSTQCAAWSIHLSGSLFSESKSSSQFGIRPVITVAQSAIR